MLLKVQRYYERHPEVKDWNKPEWNRMQEPSSVAYPVGCSEDLEVVDYLRHHFFSLPGRLEFVAERVRELALRRRKVSCFHCGEGELRVRPEDWEAFTEPDSVTWYWPDWHGFGDNGDLTVKASGFQGGDHWTGAHTVEVDNPDYAFWKWLVKQPQYHRIVQEDELPAIREEFARTQFS